MNQTDYAYGVAYIRALENSLLKPSDVEGLLLAKTPDEVMRQLADKGYSAEPTEVRDFEKLLAEQTEKCWETVREVAPKGAPLDILLYENDFHNIKVAVKATFAGVKDYSRLLLAPGTVKPQQLAEAAAQQKLENLPQRLQAAARCAYETLASTEDGQLCDVLLDKMAMDAMEQAAEKSGSSFVQRYVRLKNALTNIKIAYRAIKTEKDAAFLEKALSENSGIPRAGLIQAAPAGEESFLAYIAEQGFSEAVNALKNGMTAFEKYARTVQNDFTNEAKYVTLGVEPLLSYILKKQAELLAVRMIVSCKINGFSEQEIRERLSM